MAKHPEIIETLRTCAFCPNTCRPSYPADARPQIESQTPSALCLVTLGVLEGWLAMDDGTRRTLARRDAARASRGHCTYGLDIPALLDTALPEATA